MSEDLLGGDPFEAGSAAPARYVPRAATERVLAAAEWTLHAGQRKLALSGPPGIGKTTLLRVLEERLRDVFDGVYVPYAALPIDGLCAWLLARLGEPASGPAELALLAAARRRAAAGRPLLVLIDDATSLPLETGRRLAALVEHGEGAIRLMVACIDDAATGPVLSALGPVVEELGLDEPMTAVETSHYVRARLAQAGTRIDVQRRFDAAMLAAIYRESLGIPRVVHTLADVVARGRLGTTAPSAPAEPWWRGFDWRRRGGSAERQAADRPLDIHDVEPPQPLPGPRAPEGTLGIEDIEPPQPLRAQRAPEGTLGIEDIEPPRPWAGSGGAERSGDGDGTPATVAATAPESSEPQPEAHAAAPGAASRTAIRRRRVAGMLLAAGLAGLLAFALFWRAGAVRLPIPATRPPPSPRVAAPAARPQQPVAPAPGRHAVQPPPSADSSLRVPAAAENARSAATQPEAETAAAVAPPPEAGAVAARGGEATEAAEVPEVSRVDVNINASPWAEVAIDGEPIGETPLTIRLAIGPHTIRVSFPDARVIEREVQVSAERRHFVFGSVRR